MVRSILTRLGAITAVSLLALTGAVPAHAADAEHAGVSDVAVAQVIDAQEVADQIEGEELAEEPVTPPATDQTSEQETESNDPAPAPTTEPAPAPQTPVADPVEPAPQPAPEQKPATPSEEPSEATPAPETSGTEEDEVLSYGEATEESDETPLELPADMTFGFKDSFWRYFNMPFTKGNLTGTDGAWGQTSLNYLLADGQTINPEDPKRVQFTGSLNFYAHDGVMDVTLANPTLTFVSPTTALLGFTASGTIDEELEQPATIQFAILRDVVLSDADGTTTIESTNVSALAGAGQVFGDSYKEGTEFSPFTAKVPTAEPEAPLELPVDLTFDFKDSFWRYFTMPFTKGSLTGTGGAWGETSLNYLLAPDQTFDPANPGDIEFAGSLNFYAHDGVMDVTLSDPVLSFDTPTSATLTFAAEGTIQDESATRVEFVHFADVTVVEEDGMAKISAERGEARDGAGIVFGSHYGEGTELGGLRATVPLAEDAEPVDPADPTDPVDPSDPGEDPTPVKPDPTPGPTKPATGTGLMEWGIKDSFISYIGTSFAGGKITTSNGAQDGFFFKLADGQTIDKSNLSRIAFNGTVHVVAHKGALDVSFNDPIIVKRGSSWFLTLDVQSKDFLGYTEVAPTAKDYGRIDFARLSAPVISEDTLTFRTVTLTPQGNTSVGNGHFWADGDILDSIVFHIGETVAPTPPPRDSNTPATRPGVSPLTDNSQHVSGSSASSSANTPAANVQCVIDETNLRATSGSLSWGVRNSFTTYIRGSIAGGGFQASRGASWNGSDFVFPLYGGQYDSDRGVGAFYYGGTVSFSGHDGMLQTTISNPVVTISGSTAYLNASVYAQDVNGNVKLSGSQITLVTMNLSGKAFSGGQLTYSAGSSSLTRAGVNAFAEFYGAGAPMDGLFGSARLVQAESCDPVTGARMVTDAFGNAGGANGAINASFAVPPVLDEDTTADDDAETDEATDEDESELGEDDALAAVGADTPDLSASSGEETSGGQGGISLPLGIGLGVLLFAAGLVLATWRSRKQGSVSA